MTEKDKAERDKLLAEARKLNAEADGIAEKLLAEARKLNAEASAIRAKELRRWLVWISIIAAGQTAAPSIIKELIKVI